MDLSMDALSLYPAWRQAEQDLLASGVTYGSVIHTDWLMKAFGIKPAATIPEHERNALEFLRQFTALRSSLLERHKMMLVSVQGVGYRVVLPEDQTKTALKQRTKELRSALTKLYREVTNVDTTKLTDAGRQENTDALAKLGALRSVVRTQLK